jgi:hypothetical protein
VLCKPSKQAVNLSVHQDGGCSSNRILEILDTDTSQKSECHAITNKYPEAVSVVQHVYKVLSDTENLAGCTTAEVGKALSEPLL